MLVDKERYIHGGGSVSEDCIDMSVNVNPLGTPDSVKNAIKDAADTVDRYPDAYCADLVSGIADIYGAAEEYIICGNGADELIYNYAQILSAGSRALIYAPAFAEYERALKSCGVQIMYHVITDFRLKISDIPESEISSVDAVFVCMPSNPSGQLIDRSVLKRLLDACRDNNVKCFLDICFYELTVEFDAGFISELVKNYSNLCVLSAFTKTYAIPGIRLGYMLCSDTEVIRKISACQQCWNVSLIAQRAGAACLECDDYVEQSREFIEREREYLHDNLTNLVMKVCESDANYILFFDERITAEKLEAFRIRLRDCSDYVGLGKGWWRTCVGTHEENERLISAIQVIIHATVRYESVN